jgi:hypothetical protein
MTDFTSYPSSSGIEGPAGPIGPQGPAGPTISQFQQDILSATGSLSIPNGSWVNFAGFPGAVVQPGGTAGIIANGLVLKFPPLVGFSQVLFSFRISGTVGGPSGAAREWQIQTRRPDGVTVVGSDGNVKVDGTSISNRDTVLVSFTNGVSDPFSVDGIQVGMLNNSGQTMTLTAIDVRIQRVINPQ